MTDTAFHGDPEGMLPKLEEVQDEVDKIYSLTINGLTEEQFKVLAENFAVSLRKDPRSRTGLFAGKLAILATLMIFLAAAVRLIVWILSGLTINA